ncbi:MAG: alpha/beta hydrolase, partial [Bacteroidota bacterium]
MHKSIYNIQRGVLPYKNSFIAYHKAGSGKKCLILFHGFGDKAALFAPIFPTLTQAFEVWAISFPYHGETHWKEGIFTKDDIVG